MSSQGAVHASPVLGNTGSGQRGSGHLAVPSAAWWPESRWNEAAGKPTKAGCIPANQRFNLRYAWEDPQEGKARVSSSDWEIRPSRIIGGPPETWPWWNWEPALQSKERGR